MKKSRLLSLILAMVFCLTLCLAACNDNIVDEHDHIWDNGEVTTEPTCHSEGVRTYSCTVKGCKQTKTSPVGMTEHSWDNGEVTTEPKCDDAGETTYKCKNDGCTATKKEPIGKTDHRWDDGVITKTSEFTSAGVRTYTCLDCKTTREVSVEAHADYVEQFYTKQADKTDWSYGAATTFDDASGNVVFAEATVENNVWKATGVEIGSGSVKLTSAKAAIVYNFTEELPKLVKVMFNVSFKGGVVKAYLVVVGEQTTVITLNENKADWTYKTENVKDALTIAKGNKVYLILDAGSATVEGELSFTIYAPCLHVWDQGIITKAPKCNEKGEKTFKCASCEEEYKQPIDEIPHEWNDGEITTEPTLDSEGVKTFTCKNCSATRTETVPRLEVDNLISNFGKDFSSTLAGESNWEVGTVAYDFPTETFSFNKLSAGDEAFKNNDPWIEIKGDWMAINAMVGLAYHFQNAASINFKLKVNTADKFSVRWALKDSAGNIKTNDGKASWGGDGKEITVTADLTVAKGDVLYVLINKDEGSDQCTFNLEIAGDELVQFDGANFGDEFESTLAGESNWEVGTVAYDFPTETFNFTKLPADVEAFKCSDPWIEIKGDWMAINAMVGLAYRFQNAASINFNLKVNTADKFSVRWAVKDKDGNIKTNDGKASWGGDGKEITVTADLTVAKGDVLYVLINKDEGSDQCTFSLEIASNEQMQPEQPFEGANFGDDFSSTLAGESNWEVGMVAYDFPTETFSFAAMSIEGEEFKSSDPWIEIKGDWMAINSMVGLAYHFQGAASINFNFTLSTADKFSVRWAVKDKDGNIKTNDGKASWGGDGKEITVTADLTLEEGDTLYILINKDEGSDQCTFSLDLTPKQ